MKSIICVGCASFACDVGLHQEREGTTPYPLVFSLPKAMACELTRC